MKTKKEIKKRVVKKTKRKVVRKVKRLLQKKENKFVPAPDVLVHVLFPEPDDMILSEADTLHERTAFVVPVQPDFTDTLTEWFSTKTDQTEDIPVQVVSEITVETPALLCTSYSNTPEATPLSINLLTQPFEILVFRPSRHVLWHAATFAVLAFMFVMPFQMFFWYDVWHQQAEAISFSAQQTFTKAENVKQALSSGNLQEIADQLKQLTLSLQATQEQYQKSDSLLKFVLRFSAKGRAAQQLLTAASAFSQTSEGLASLASALSSSSPTPADAIFSVPFFTRLVAQKPVIARTISFFRTGYQEIKTINPEALPDQLKNNWPEMLTTLKTADGFLDLAQDQFDLWYKLFGSENTKRYVLVFQNPHELRATGGFWGSLAELTMRQGVVTRLNFPGGGPYDLAGISRAHVQPPLPLQYVNPEWQIQDANWYFDFPSSAKQFMWFYGKSGGPTLDGVIALSADLLPEILKLTGPIDLPDYKTTVTADNFYEVTQSQVEFLYDKKENKPKKFIGDLLSLLIPKMGTLEPAAQLKLANLLLTSLTEKNIMFYAADPQLQTRLDQYQWTGSLRMGTGDYLAVVETNIGGAKTDAKIIQNGLLNIAPGAQGITQTLEITRKHTGKRGQPLYGATNHAFWRIYVPKEAHLISVDGAEEPTRAEPYTSNVPLESNPELTALTQAAQKFSDLVTITPIADKQEISFWQHLAPGEEKTLRLVFTAPRSLPGPAQDQSWHTWYLQKQPGAVWNNFSLNVVTDPSSPPQKLLSSLSQEWEKTATTWSSAMPWKKDEWLAIRF